MKAACESSCSAHAAALHSAGWTVVSGIIPQAVCATIRAGVLSAIEGGPTPADLAGRPLGKLPNILRLPGCGPAVGAHINCSLLPVVVRKVLGSKVKLTFATAQANYVDNVQGGWHADWPYNKMNARRYPAPYPAGPDHLRALA